MIRKKSSVYTLVFFSLLLFFISGCTDLLNKEITITFDSNGGTNVSSITYEDIEEIVWPSHPTKEGFTFGGWYTDNQTFLIPFNVESLVNQPLTQSITLYAKWNPQQFMLTYELNGGTVNGSNPSSYYTNDPLVTLISPTKEGFTFAGWYVDSNLTTPFNMNVMPAYALTLYAKWETTLYQLTFVNFNDSVLATYSFAFGTSLSSVIAPHPIRVGHTFAGWSIALPQTMPASDVIIRATYTINSYTITFETNIGSHIDPLSLNYLQTISLPDDPIKEGHYFAGWYMDTLLTIPFGMDTMPDSHFTLYAKWSTELLDLEYREIDETPLFIETYPYGMNINEIDLPTLEKLGYTFEGWYIDKAFSIPFNESSILTESLVLYAKWEPILNEFGFIVTQRSATHVTIQLHLKGQIMINGYDLIIHYNASHLSYVAHTKGYADVINVTIPGQIRLNYSSALVGLNSEVMILEIQFSIIEPVETQLTVSVVEAVYVDAQFNVTYVDTHQRDLYLDHQGDE